MQYSVSLPWHFSAQSQRRNSRLGSSLLLRPHLAQTRARRGWGPNSDAVDGDDLRTPRTLRRRATRSGAKKSRKLAIATRTPARVCMLPVASAQITPAAEIRPTHFIFSGKTN